MKLQILQSCFFKKISNVQKVKSEPMPLLFYPCLPEPNYEAYCLIFVALRSTTPDTKVNKQLNFELLEGNSYKNSVLFMYLCSP